MLTKKENLIERNSQKYRKENEIKSMTQIPKKTFNIQLFLITNAKRNFYK